VYLNIPCSIIRQSNECSVCQLTLVSKLKPEVEFLLELVTCYLYGWHYIVLKQVTNYDVAIEIFNNQTTFCIALSLCIGLIDLRIKPRLHEQFFLDKFSLTRKHCSCRCRFTTFFHKSIHFLKAI
jgi:hypothetical protein